MGEVRLNVVRGYAIRHGIDPAKPGAHWEIDKLLGTNFPDNKPMSEAVDEWFDIIMEQDD